MQIFNNHRANDKAATLTMSQKKKDENNDNADNEKLEIMIMSIIYLSILWLGLIWCAHVSLFVGWTIMLMWMREAWNLVEMIFLKSIGSTILVDLNLSII